MEGPKDDFRWFGEGFDGFPKRLPEDVVEYMVFIIDSKLSDVQTRERLQAFQRALTALEKKFLKEYIWQRDSIKLDLVREDGRWLLKGITNYGDSVADEWLIVYFLRELSKEFKDAWIRIYDSDGEFLLIEAANALPNWLNPEVAENRVWINHHRLVIIPLSKEQTPAPLGLTEALSIIRETPARPQHYPKIEKEAFHRLNGYPEAISTNQHHATLLLPRKVAHFLHLNPSYISPAVEAFYLRDPVALCLLEPKKSKKELAFPLDDFVEVSTRFTKVLYAQLLGQNWDPPDAYATALEQLKNRGQPPEKAEVAVKLVAGLEILVAHEIYADKTATREIQLLLEDLDEGNDVLPTDAEVASWPKRDDDEAWLNIDFAEFERELDGKGGKEGFGDKDAQANLKKMVERFNAFLNDDEAGLDGADGLGPMDLDDDSDAERRAWDDPDDSDSAPGHASGADASDDDDVSDDANADAEYAEYEKAYEKFMSLSAAEKAILTDDARELALAEEAEQEEDDEIQKLSEMMEAELFGHGALHRNPERGQKSRGAKDQGTSPITSDKGKGKAKVEELPEDDADESEDEVLDDDYNLAENMLKAFKGQVGMAGPAGNLMGLMGVQFPPDADDERKSRGKGKAPVR
ncbi:SGT1 family protein Sgt1 [Bimuria novae-zelandiae CBS 107.79]|uniref:SGT1 family protein Sgt1 n=1 Tax=Bimuria novae-zelandiae CBS 107.79 TaxID=1447943 RepID=A0A6A5VJ57_9PLEO|nr:SGT1 family protein Sgt1 [Bimuria novae-zelandiae CBS 107.79]